MLWLPLLALTLGGLTKRAGINVGWSQLAVGLVVCALATHLLARPHAIGQASQLVASGGLLGVLQQASVKSARIVLGPGLYLVLAGGILFAASALAALLFRRPPAESPAPPLRP